MYMRLMWEDGADTYIYLSIPIHTLFTQKLDKFDLIQRKLKKIR